MVYTVVSVALYHITNVHGLQISVLLEDALIATKSGPAEFVLTERLRRGKF